VGGVAAGADGAGADDSLALAGVLPSDEAGVFASDEADSEEGAELLAA
jgi:hypothetical protein